MRLRSMLAACFLLFFTRALPAEEAAAFTRTNDVIYGRKYGLALTMDVFTPTKAANGAGVVWIISGGWFSRPEAILPAAPFSPVNDLIGRGYTVFAVVHGSQPKFAIPEILEDMHRAVRYIRSRAGDFKIDPQRLGITGGSAGGHLSLMQGTAGKLGDPKAIDLLERESSRVQAVACYFPPTDFLNYGKPGENALGRGVLKDFAAPFRFVEFDPKRGKFGDLVAVTDEAKVLEIGKQISPINHVSPDDAPTLIIHGDKDALVPIQQAEIMIAKLKDASVPAELYVKQGAGHGWLTIQSDMPKIGAWFDRYLKTK